MGTGENVVRVCSFSPSHIRRTSAFRIKKYYLIRTRSIEDDVYHVIAKLHKWEYCILLLSSECHHMSTIMLPVLYLDNAFASSSAVWGVQYRRRLRCLPRLPKFRKFSPWITRHEEER